MEDIYIVLNFEYDIYSNCSLLHSLADTVQLGFVFCLMFLERMFKEVLLLWIVPLFLGNFIMFLLPRRIF